MEYAKQLLKKEKVSLGEFEIYSSVFEMLSNQQELKNIAKKILSTLKSLEGEVTLVEFNENKFKVVNHLGTKEEVERLFENKSILKKIKETKKPYFSQSAEEKDPDYFMALPILSKEEFLGALCIHKEQKVEAWKEIHLTLHLMSFIFKYYGLIEANKNINTKDIVTDLFNYRHFQDQLDLELEKTTRYYIPLSLVLIDIKDFKVINERLGYDAGDEVLKQLSIWIKQQCRRVDMPARLNDDTFGILLSNTNEEGAIALLNRIMFKVNNFNIKAGGREFKIKVKTSITPYEAHLSREEFIQNGKDNLK